MGMLYLGKIHDKATFSPSLYLINKLIDFCPKLSFGGLI